MTALLMSKAYNTPVCRQNMRFEQEVNEASPLTYLITRHDLIKPCLSDINQSVSVRSPEVLFQIINPARREFKPVDRLRSDNRGSVSGG